MIEAPRRAVATRCFAGSLREKIRSAALTGAAGVQFDARDELPPKELGDTARRQFLHDLEERGLVVGSLAFPLRRALGDQEGLDARVAALRQAMEFTRQLRASVLSLKPGPIPVETDAAEYQILREVLTDLAAYGNHVGVTLALALPYESQARGVALLRSITSGLLGIDFDPSVVAVSGQKPHEIFRGLHESVIHITARDAIRDYDGTVSEVALGRGEVDWIEFLPLLLEAEYTGWLTVVRTQGDDRAGDASRGVQFLGQVLLEQ